MDRAGRDDLRPRGRDRLAGDLPQLVYIKEPAPERDAALTTLLNDVRDGDRTSYGRFRTPDELEELVTEDLAVLLSERFENVQPAVADHSRRAPVPAVLTPTIGRDGEVAEIVRLFDAGARLVTVTGPGGVGKTRVALEAAHALARRGSGVVHHVRGAMPDGRFAQWQHGASDDPFARLQHALDQDAAPAARSS